VKETVQHGIHKVGEALHLTGEAAKEKASEAAKK
jgi:hypothetical protein